MNSVHGAVLRKSLPYLMDNIYDVNEMLDYLYASDILTGDAKESISEMSTTRKRKQLLVDMLPSLGPRAYQCFLDALIGASYSFVADELRRVEATEVAAVDWLYSELNEDARQRLVTQHELVFVARDMSPRHLVPVGLAMGLPRGRLDQYEAVNAHSPTTQVQLLLCDWAAEKSRGATVVAFVTLMREARVEEDAYKYVFVNNCAASVTSRQEQAQARFV